MTDAAQFSEHSNQFKALIEAITTYELPQLKLYLSNVQKNILEKKDQFHSQFDSVSNLLNSLKEAKGKVPLHFACARGNTAVVAFLIEQLKADLTIKDKEGNNMFFTAIQHGHIDLADYFITQHKISVNTVKDGGISPIHIASNSNDVQMIRFLHSKGADLEKISTHGKPIDWAIGRNNTDAAKQLLRLGADPNGDLSSTSIPSPIILAIDFGSTQIYEALVSNQKLSLDATDPEGFTILHIAAEKGNIDIVKDLVSRGLGKFINKEIKGKTPFYLAFENSHWSVVNFLKDYTHSALEIQKKVSKMKDQQKNQKSDQPAKAITEQDKKRAEELKNEGNKLYGEKKHAQALELYFQANKLDPQNQIIWRNMAASYLGLEKYQQALESCQKAKKDNVKNVKTLYREAQSYIGLKNHAEAAGSLWECVMLEPKNTLFMTQFQKQVNIAKEQHQKK